MIKEIRRLLGSQVPDSIKKILATKVTKVRTSPIAIQEGVQKKAKDWLTAMRKFGIYWNNADR